MSSSNILLAYGNKAPGATLAGGQWDSTLALNNLKTGKLAQVARSSNATVYNTRFRFDLGANYVLRALALVNHNLTTAARWRVRVGTAAMDVNYAAYDDPRDERVGYSGAANGTRVNSIGLIEAKTAPRIDYDPVTLANKGLLVEEGRTNNLTYTESFATNWTSDDVADLVQDATTAPDGGGAGQLQFSTGSYRYTIETATATPHFYSNYAKLGSGGNATVILTNEGVASGTFDLNAGTISGAPHDSAILLAAGASWWRAGIGFTGTAAPTAFGFVIGGSFTVGQGHYFWGAQLESGAFPTSYIPTTTTAVTRTADTATITSTSFTAAHSATAGTLYAEFDVCTTVAGTRPVLSLDNDTANERIELYASGTDLKFKVVDGGSTVVDMTIGTIAANTAYKVAVAWAANDFAASLGGAAVVTDSSGTLPTLDRMRIGANQAGDYLNGHIKRFARWLTRRTNAELQSLATTGPEALGIDTGWQNALRMTFHGDTPANWGEQYPLIATFDTTTARYGTVEIEDTANPDGYVELGQLFVAGGLQPGKNAEYQGYGDGRTDLSSSVKSVGGQKYSTQRRRPRTADFNFPFLTQAEGDHLDEMMAEVGTTEDVLYSPYPADPAKNQRYGMLCTLRELTPLEYPFFDRRAMPLRVEQKL